MAIDLQHQSQADVKLQTKFFLFFQNIFKIIRVSQLVRKEALRLSYYSVTTFRLVDKITLYIFFAFLVKFSLAYLFTT